LLQKNGKENILKMGKNSDHKLRAIATGELVNIQIYMSGVFDSKI
jgi:hypothetical protein